MPASNARMKANNKFNKKVYDNIGLRIRKDSEINKAVISAHAEKNGESLNGYILRLIREDIGKE